MKANVLELVLHHDYRTGQAQDISGHHNHGHLRNLVLAQGRSANDSVLSFNGINSRITVPPSRSLSRLGSLRIDAMIWLEDLGGRRNIMEGFLAFAFIIDEDGSIRAGVYNGRRWNSVPTPSHTMPLREWTEVTFIYDGMDTGAIYLNNQLAAKKFWELGSVHGVQWPFGISIGAWPDADSFVFKGKMEQVRLWRSSESAAPWLKVGKEIE